MSFSYVFILPFCLGWVAVKSSSPQNRARWTTWLIRPIAVVCLCMLTAFIVGWEGTICVIMAFPVYLPIAIMGGLSARFVYKDRLDSHKSSYVILLLPVMIGPLETSYFQAPKEIRSVYTEHILNASAEEIWPHIIRVKRIDEPQKGHHNLRENG